MPHSIGDHALLADGRTAALLDPEGNVAWLCWPRVDSMPLLLGILDPVRGGVFSLRPAAAGARLLRREYLPGTLVLRSEWTTGRSRILVSEALAWEGAPRLVRIARCRGPAVEMVARFAPAFDAGRARAVIELDGHVATASAGGMALAVSSTATWEPADDGAAVSRAELDGEAPFSLMLSAPADIRGADPEQAMDGTTAHWRALSTSPSPAALSPLTERVLGPQNAGELLHLSGNVLIGLRNREGGIVAAPTTSLPQWPGSARTWDYRYSWLRDTSLAGIALARLGHLDQASALGTFVGRVAGETPLPALVRVDGSPPPAEVELGHLDGYGGAHPVRIGNAAATQPQLDVVGEVVELAACLEAAGALPETLRTQIPRLADWTVDSWTRPDHGIWEIRGVPRRYTHSRLMAWVALTGAGALADGGAIAGNRERWRGCASEISKALLKAPGFGALELHDGGGGADAALALVPLVGLLAPDHPRVSATLDLILARLGTTGLIDRYQGRPDQLPDPCGPFLFPSFWLASALEYCGRDGSRLFAAACRARGSSGLFGEVAHPTDGTPLGNYPQVQSHAAFILAATGTQRGLTWS